MYLCIIADQENINGNFNLDPLFPDIANGDYRIVANSPCAPANNSCGVLIGAMGVNCPISYICGDTNGDGCVNAADLNTVGLNWQLNLEEGGPESGDFNRDGVVNAADLNTLARLPQPKVCVSAPASTGPADFVSRLFAPAIGIPEDPVNGNSHTVLAPYWSEKTGKQSMISHYVSERSGEVRVRLAGDRVKISGHAVTVMRGTLEY